MSRGASVSWGKCPWGKCLVGQLSFGALGQVSRGARVGIRYPSPSFYSTTTNPYHQISLVSVSNTTSTPVPQLHQSNEPPNSLPHPHNPIDTKIHVHSKPNAPTPNGE